MNWRSPQALRTGSRGTELPIAASLCLRRSVEVQANLMWLPCTSGLAARPLEATLFLVRNLAVRHYSAFQLDPNWACRRVDRSQLP